MSIYYFTQFLWVRDPVVAELHGSGLRSQMESASCRGCWFLKSWLGLEYMPQSQHWQFGTGCWQEASFLTTYASPEDCLSVLMTCSWFPPEWSKRNEGGSYSISSAIAAYCHLCCILLITWVSPYYWGGDYSGAWIPGHRNRWGPSWSMAARAFL